MWDLTPPCVGLQCPRTQCLAPCRMLSTAGLALQGRGDMVGTRLEHRWDMAGTQLGHCRGSSASARLSQGLSEVFWCLLVNISKHFLLMDAFAV